MSRLDLGLESSLSCDKSAASSEMAFQTHSSRACWEDSREAEFVKGLAEGLSQGNGHITVC